MRVETAIPEDLPPEIAAQGPHPNWIKLIERQRTGNPQKFVSAGLMTKCSRCGEWKHLSQFYSRIKANIYTVLSGPPSDRTIAYGIPTSYCKLCQQGLTKKYNIGQRKLYEDLAREISAEDAREYDEANIKQPAYLKLYPELEAIADELRKQYAEDVNESILSRLVDEGDAKSLWSLWDQMAEDGLVPPVKLKGRDR